VADFAATTRWHPKGAWAGILDPGRLGRQTGAPGLIVQPQDGLRLCSMIAPATRTEEVSDRIAGRFGLALPTTPRIVETSDIGLIWAGRDQWLARSARPDLAVLLEAEIGDVAAIADQSDARAILRLSGLRVREVLAKGCMIDLHPRAFRPGDVALTSIAHIGVQLWQLDDEPTYEIAVFRSLAGSFWSWLQASAAEFGCEILPAAPARS
jgi:sarcosine oxidase subunit gamma